jgi:hypothetical protein
MRPCAKACRRSTEPACWPRAARSAEEIDRLLAMDIELNAQGMGVWLDKLVA